MKSNKIIRKITKGTEIERFFKTLIDLTKKLVLMSLPKGVNFLLKTDLTVLECTYKCKRNTIEKEPWIYA